VSAVDGGVGVHGTNDYLDLTVHSGFLLWAASGQGKQTNTLAIETHILRLESNGGAIARFHCRNNVTHFGETLGKSNLVAFFGEVTQCEGVTDSVSGCESLIRHIKKGEERTFLNYPIYIQILFRSYAMLLLTLTISDISAHCAGVGSMPVGLCAQAWNNTIDFSGAA
jgi:hypothetical protein